MVGIYKITNLTNNKIYIGQSVDIQKRINRHKTTAFNMNDKAYDNPLYRSIRKYGIENFSFEIIELLEKEQLNERERYWIKYYDSFNPEKGYNLTLGGDSNSSFHKLDYIQLQEIKKLLSESDILLKDIADKFNISLITIKDINQGLSWYEEGIDYPLRKYGDNKVNYRERPKKIYICQRCQKEISKGASYCFECSHLLQRKSIRPSREELKNLIRTIPFTQIAQQFEVSDKAIVKWCISENLPSKKKDIKQYSDEEWKNI